MLCCRVWILKVPLISMPPSSCPSFSIYCASVMFQHCAGSRGGWQLVWPGSWPYRRQPALDCVGKENHDTEKYLRSFLFSIRLLFILALCIRSLHIKLLSFIPTWKCRFPCSLHGKYTSTAAQQSFAQSIGCPHPTVDQTTPMAPQQNTWY